MNYLFQISKIVLNKKYLLGFSMGLLNIGISSLLSSQTAINTTGNNIANAQVDGYTRQQAEFNTEIQD